MIEKFVVAMRGFWQSNVGHPATTLYVDAEGQAHADIRFAKRHDTYQAAQKAIEASPAISGTIFQIEKIFVKP